MGSAAIQLKKVSLNYRVFHEHSHSLKATVISKLKKRDQVELFPALKAVDLEVSPGESVAVMGPNGSGKSTLLKLIAGIFGPSAGQVEVNGKIATLLELGAGFAPDLTGLENIYLNAALLGQSKKWTQDHFDDIVAFSELAHFIDSPLRHYSSGMYMRLGFSVAIFAKTDILLFDEVIAVGDAGFQAKCYDAIAQRRKNGACMLIVSHSPQTVKTLCDRGIVLNHGQIVFDGAIDSATQKYQNFFR